MFLFIEKIENEPSKSSTLKRRGRPKTVFKPADSDETSLMAVAAENQSENELEIEMEVEKGSVEIIIPDETKKPVEVEFFFIIHFPKIKIKKNPSSLEKSNCHK